MPEPHEDRTAPLARGLATLLLILAPALGSSPAFAQTTPVTEARLQQRASELLTLMGFGLTPDVTVGSLSISDSPTGNPSIYTTTLGGGFTVSREWPIYLEGTAGYSRYDPKFVVSDGNVERVVPTRWNLLSVTAGVGWDIPVVQDLVFRPILNLSYGRAASDVARVASLAAADRDSSFLNGAPVDAFGLGWSLMLDYERYRAEGDIDAELRFTNIYLRTDSRDAEIQGRSIARSLNLWTRWRAPTGFVVFDRPLRYVLEFAHTSYFGDLDGAIGFDHLNSIGLGAELDTSRFERWVTRVRLVGRYRFGPNVRGTSVGLAVSF